MGTNIFAEKAKVADRSCCADCSGNSFAVFSFYDFPQPKVADFYTFAASITAFWINLMFDH